MRLVLPPPIQRTERLLFLLDPLTISCDAILLGLATEDLGTPVIHC